MPAVLADHFTKPAVQLVPLNKKEADRYLREFLAELNECDESELASDISSCDEFAGFLKAVFSLSPYLRDLALVRTRLIAGIFRQPFDDYLASEVASVRDCWKEIETESALMERLRFGKRRVSLALGLADLGGWLEAAAVTDWLSRFADAALGAACDFLLRGMHQSGRVELADPASPSAESGLLMLAMGKYGARELNYSSDIDIIIFFDLSRKMKVNTDDPTSLFVRFAKSLVRIMQERTGDGYVFRTDLRLRPDPGSTPLAIPVETAFNYYEAYGQNWERAAFIKARACAGDEEAGRRFLEELAPFIWRKYLDFAAIQDVHSIKRQIHAHKGHGEIAVRGHNVKLGRGGIREIEFFVQTQQLIAGGRRPQLRQISTIAALNALAGDSWIDRSAVDVLTGAYWYLRDVEHRIQMVADEQSHTLPEDDKGLERIAYMMGNRTRQEFEETLVATMRKVETHYADLFESSPELTGAGGNLVFTGEDDDPATLETLTRLGFKKPSQVISTIKGWHFGRFPAVQTAQARELLTELTPALIEAFSGADSPDESLFAFDRFVSGLPAGIQLFSILKSNANLTSLLVHILGAAPRLSEIITRRPHVFDSLIDPTFGAGVPDSETLHERLRLLLSRTTGYEAKLDQARIFAAEQKFLIGIRLINRTINARQAGIAFSDLAEVLLGCVLEVVREEFQRKHGTVKGGGISVIGMGRLGSRELTAGSDLDLIFLYRHDEDAEASDGDKQLYPQQYFVRLVQRLIAAMSAPTAEGVVYELDFRLRPSGNSGPLATYLDSFVKYQREEAWTWERQALSRARPVAGDPALVRETGAMLNTLLSEPQDGGRIAKDIAEMRATIDKEKPAANVFDVKLAKGGLTDIEFIAQWGILETGNAGTTVEDRSTLALIGSLPETLLPVEERETLTHAFELYNSILQILRLCLNEEFDPKNASRGIAGMLTLLTGQPDLKALQLELEMHQKAVRAIFNRLLI
ncbi:MAG: bifunctional [glutamine synthetase] adenylyltransferase/[glutamine synthetase]-adenylyl-L-tyrosine phosphorylase [Nitratireductor sp.]|nr:bifunctional [glutamine synthetase] adenylyltransferase/[glutamine synthetase]-adenylyl-L-tyrosine phosphorylase [Nitratireductor sp.]